MTKRHARSAGPVVLTRPRRIRPGRSVAPRAELLTPEALDAPMPGQLLVLLSRLHRAEPTVRGDESESAA